MKATAPRPTLSDPNQHLVPTHKHTWWMKGIIYQVYPRSFKDTTGSGTGDLNGIWQQLDYLQWLGVSAVWLSPVYPSPMVDFGYDISDYTDIDPLFGTLADMDRLIEGIHARGMRLLMDLVPNHTSDQHPWFVQSRSSRDNPYRHWYIWRDPHPGGGPPNNWLSCFGGSAWELDAATGQYYYHAFCKEQPDLNWRNPEVQAAVADVMRFWLRRGADGFRVDALREVIKDDQFRDNPVNPDWKPGQDPYHRYLPLYTMDRPEVYGVVEFLRSVLDEFEGDRLCVGELHVPLTRLMTYYEAGCQIPCNFQLVALPWQARPISSAIRTYEAALPSDDSWPNWMLGDHDFPRVASRAGRASAGVAAMLLLTLRGTPTMYYGDELAMVDVPIPPDQVQDPFEKQVPGIGLGRDPCRTPMQWDNSKNAGFTAGQPWLPVAADYAECNVARLQQDPRSVLNLYRRLIALRHATHALHVGSYEPFFKDESNEMSADTVAFLRHGDGESFSVLLNFAPRDIDFNPAPRALLGEIVLSTALERAGEPVDGRVALRPFEGLIVRLRHTSSS